MFDKFNEVYFVSYCKVLKFNESVLEEKGKHMVALKGVEKPISGLKQIKKVDRDSELQMKFSQLSKEEHVLKNYEASKNKVRHKTMFYPKLNQVF